MDDVTLDFGEEHAARRFKHPIAIFFHLAFRVLAVVAYLLCGWFSDSFIANFVVIVLFVSMDFWTVKNITGRLLVGLRWWNYIDEEGKSHWVFESRKGAAQSSVSDAESRIFWLALIVGQLFWTVFVFTSLFGLNFKWFMVVCVAFVLNGSNLFGYIYCKLGKKENIKSAATNFIGRHVLKSMLSSTPRQPESATQ